MEPHPPDSEPPAGNESQGSYGSEGNAKKKEGAEEGKQENNAPEPGRGHWTLSLFVALLCIAAAASGWSATRWFVDDPQEASAHSETTAATPTADAQPENPEAYVAAAADRVDKASAFHMTFTVQSSASITLPSADDRGGVGSSGTDVFKRLPTTITHMAGGWGQARYDVEQSPSFEHLFTTLTGAEVYRYDLDDGRFAMSTSTPGSGLTVLNQPSTADQYLSSSRFASAKLYEILDTSTDLALVDQEKVELEWPELRSTHSAYHYTGTFTAMLGGFDPRTGSNSLNAVQNAEFDLWIDTEGYPRKFAYSGRDGTGATYEYHSFG